MYHFITVLSIAAMLLSLLTGMISLAKKPRSIMKASFSVFSLLVAFANGLYLFEVFSSVSFPLLFFRIRDFLLIGSLLYFGWNFPNYFRNLPIISRIVWFIFGAVFFCGIYSVFVESLNEKFHAVLVIVSYTLFGWIAWRKTWTSFRNIQKFMLFGLIFHSVNIFLTILLYANVLAIDEINKNNISLIGLDLTFLSTYLLFLYNFTFSHNYISIPFSSLIEKAKLIYDNVEFANPQGAKIMKKSLLDFYKESKLTEIMDVFHFQLLIDETIDNAIEHGGKRSDDDITVSIYESDDYYDLYVIDRGKGFDPRSIPNPLEKDRKMVPSGRGIHILKKFFLVRWNFLGNEICVRISKSLIQ
ncbi:ATP-binding protein [Leptospira sp. GIMC2001]|uniref:ATP-binding protein n=1 Tax=Leptospira sp. GIMC2001 TaxID=1513297 RepID=UPI00234991EE|nr:ATP-binding protein [Leptospira sp. GIMC2001]WCL47566.1 ATP-binding protein [Leptospira sp. GIMC2001]